MPKLHYFYPENDLALAAGIARYTAPAPAMRLSNAGRLLPLWYGTPGDLVLCYGANDRWLTRVQRDFNLATDIFSHIYNPALEAAPWGWSAASRQIFYDEGFPPSALPDDERLQRLRALSHRRTASTLARILREDFPDMDLPGPSIEVHSLSEAGDAIAALAGAAVVKLPWSSSGRGVVNALEVGKDRALSLAANGIRSQGSVMIEPAMDRAIDFAALFECRLGKCRFAGTSVFDADARGHYVGNLLAKEEERLRRIGMLFPIRQFKEITKCLETALDKIVAPVYSGPLGVDMLIDKQGRIHPAVELNLRMTMGHVANIFADAHLADGSEGRFSVVPIKGESPDDDYVSEGGKLVSGTLLLTPRNPHFAFMVQVSAKS